MDDCSAYQTDTAKLNSNKIIIAGGIVAAIVAIFAFSNVSGAPPENSASMEQASTFAEPVGTTATTANHILPVGATANSPQPVELPPTGANSTQPDEASATTASSTQSVEVPATTAKFTQLVEAPTTSATPTRTVETPTATESVQSSKRKSMSKKDITKLQARLHSLGYLSVSPTGTFGPKTRAALRAFKAANGLPEDEMWDEETKTRLASKKAIRTPTHVVDAVKRW